MAYNFQTRSTYSFEVYPENMFDTDFKNVVVLGIVEYETASKYADIFPLHARVYPYLPAGTPDDPRAYDYLLIRTTAGVSTVIGIPWIRENTITLIEATTIRILVGGVSASDLTTIRNILVQNGYNNLEMNLVS